MNLAVTTLCLLCLIPEAGAQEQVTGDEQPGQSEGNQPEQPEPEQPAPGWIQRFLTDNFTFKKELYLQLTSGYQVAADPPLYSRQSAGFEILKKFSTSTSTFAAFDAQGRLVRRDNYIEVLNDLEGTNRQGFYPEYHNLYLDLYNVLDPFLSQSGRGRNLGRFNWRTGHFYLPFGINLQTDTHATLLQLSNEQDFGFDRDWYTGLYGSLTRDINYDAYYLLGSGYYPRFHGQSGMFGARVSLGSRFLSEYGFEGGISVLSGERLSGMETVPPPENAGLPEDGNVIHTLRVGMDGRHTRMLWGGTGRFTMEISGGEDRPSSVFMQLYQFEYTSRSRKWGWAAQYRRLWLSSRPSPGGDPADASLIGEFTLYGENDITGSNLRWIKFNVERRLEHRDADRAWVFTVQYYYYR